MTTRRRWLALSQTQALARPVGSRMAVGLIPAMLLVTPVVVLLRANDYSLARREVLLVLLLFSLPGLASALLFRRRWFSPLIVMMAATFFAEVRFPSLGAAGALSLAAVGFCSVCHRNFQRITLAMLATLLLSSLVLRVSEPITPRPATDAASSTEPFVLEIILDEHIGLQGLSAAGEAAESVAAEIRRFFGDRGFSVFPEAYSEHSATRDSLSHAFNLSSGTFQAANYETGSGRFTWRLTHNRLFESLLARGYALRVFQSDYIDLCVTPGNVECDTYSIKDLGILQDSPIPASERVSIIVSSCLRYSSLYLLFRGIYQEVHDRLQPLGIGLPPWTWQYQRVSPVSAMRVTRRVEEELRHARPGRAVVVHLLLPHGPYILDERCRFKPAASWDTRTEFDRTMTAEARRRLYVEYAAQTRCAYSTLGRLLDAIPESMRADSTVVVHGDHGSRIARHDSEAPRPQLSRADLLDDYSTLFAIRSRRVGVAGSDDLEALSCLVRASLVDQGPFLPALAACRGTPQVYLAGAGRFVPYPGPSDVQEVVHP